MINENNTFFITNIYNLHMHKQNNDEFDNLKYMIIIKCLWEYKYQLQFIIFYNHEKVHNEKGMSFYYIHITKMQNMDHK